MGVFAGGGEEFFVTAKGMEFLDKYQRFSGKALRVDADVMALRNEAARALDLSFASMHDGSWAFWQRGDPDSFKGEDGQGCPVEAQRALSGSVLVVFGRE